MPITNPIAAPANRQPTTGLLAVADRPNTGDGRWEGGYGFSPETCDDGQVTGVGCEVDTEKLPPSNPPAVENEPFILVAGDRCTAMVTDRDRDQRAARHLEHVQSSLIELVLWQGATGNPTGEINVPRQHLASERADVLTSVAVEPLHAIGVLDHALTRCNHGVQGMVHVTPYMLVRLVADTLVFRENGRWLTPNGHLVVAGSGYTGGGPRPDADQVLPSAPDIESDTPVDQWIYGTSMVSVLLGNAEPLADINHRDNTITTLRERSAGAYFGCCHFAVEVDLTPTP